MRVQVTAEDIAAGEPGNLCACPIALAVARAAHRYGGLHLPADTRVFVSASFGIAIELEREREMLYARLPPIARLFIMMYDKDCKVEPFEFDVELLTAEEIAEHACKE